MFVIRDLHVITSLPLAQNLDKMFKKFIICCELQT